MSRARLISRYCQSRRPPDLGEFATKSRVAAFLSQEQAGEPMASESTDRDPQPRLEPGRLYFVQLLNPDGAPARANVPARLCARFLHQKLHRAAGNSDLLIRQFTFEPCGASDSAGGEITLSDSTFYAERLTVPTATVIHVDFTRRISGTDQLAAAAAR